HKLCPAAASHRDSTRRTQQLTARWGWAGWGGVSAGSGTNLWWCLVKPIEENIRANPQNSSDINGVGRSGGNDVYGCCRNGAAHHRGYVSWNANPNPGR